MEQNLASDEIVDLDDASQEVAAVSAIKSEAVALESDRGPATAIQRAIEAILLVSSDPVSSKSIALVLAVSETDVIAEMGKIARFYLSTGRGFELAKIAGGYQLRTSGELAPILERYLNEQLAPRLSGAAL